MTFLPIVDRELRVVARLKSTYRNRVFVAGTVSVVAIVMLLFGVFSATPSQVGRSMFWTLTYLALFYCLMEGARRTADCLSEEKREGTLGLLFLTDLRGYDVVLGKLAAVSLNSIYGLFSLLPVLALPMLLGGVMPGEFWRIVLALANALFFSLCAGMLVSCWCVLERRAITGTFSVILAITVLPLVIQRVTPGQGIAQFSPIYAVYSADSGIHARLPETYWRTIGLTQVWSWGLLIWASLIAPSCWREEKDAASLPRWGQRSRSETEERRATRFARRERMLNVNPAYWLAGRDAGPRVFLSLLIAAAAVLAAVFIASADFDGVWWFLGISLGLNFLLKFRVAIQATHGLAEARRNNALEMLLSTPLTVEKIIQGQVLALKRSLAPPILTILAIEIAGLLGGLLTASFQHQFEPEDSIGYLVLGGGVVAYLLLYALDMFAVAWAGMWFGLSAKKESQAVNKTVLIAIGLPALSMWLFCYGFPLVIGIPIFLIAWSGGQLRREFRNLAAQRYAPDRRESVWEPHAASRKTVGPFG